MCGRLRHFFEEIHLVAEPHVVVFADLQSPGRRCLLNRGSNRCGYAIQSLLLNLVQLGGCRPLEQLLELHLPFCLMPYRLLVHRFLCSYQGWLRILDLFAGFLLLEVVWLLFNVLGRLSDFITELLLLVKEGRGGSYESILLVLDNWLAQYWLFWVVRGFSSRAYAALAHHVASGARKLVRLGLRGSYHDKVPLWVLPTTEEWVLRWESELWYLL